MTISKPKIYIIDAGISGLIAGNQLEKNVPSYRKEVTKEHFNYKLEQTSKLLILS